MRILTTILLSLLAVAALAADDEAAGSWGLMDLMRERSEVTGGKASFEETRSLEMLSDPLQLEGTLVYRAPDYVRKTITHPQRQELEVTGDQVTVTEDGREQRQFQTDDHPALSGLVTAIRGTLAGNLDSLERHFEVTFQGRRGDWELLLLPSRERLSEAISRIVIRGDGPALRRVEVREANGDSSVMRIH